MNIRVKAAAILTFANVCRNGICQITCFLSTCRYLQKQRFVSSQIYGYMFRKYIAIFHCRDSAYTIPNADLPVIL